VTRLSDIEGAEVRAAGGARLGTVERVLFHPAKPRAVALMIRPEPALVVVSMPVAYLAWERVGFGEGVVRSDAAKLPSRKSTEKSLTLDMDTTVIWRGMTVRDAGGEAAGTVADVELLDDGAVSRMQVSGGFVGDAAVGRVTVPGAEVAGYEDGAVRLTVGRDALVATGGLAKTAAAASEAAREQAARTASAAGEAVVDASYIAGRAIRSAAGSAPLKKTKATFRNIADAFREGWDGPAPKP